MEAVIFSINRKITMYKGVSGRVGGREIVVFEIYDANYPS